MSLDLESASKFEVIDETGKKVAFGTLFADQKTVVVFIRHFFCGFCQAYVERLATISPTTLSHSGLKLVVIGCGDYQPIKSYAENTKFPASQIFANPKRDLFQAMGLTTETLERTPVDEQKKSYLIKSPWSYIASSIWSGPLKNPSLIGKQGPIAQLGGEFILGPGNQCSFSHQMKHTEDHIEVNELLSKAGLEPL